MIFFLLIIVILLFGKTLLPSKDQIIYGGDLLTQFYFWKGYLVENIKEGVIPFWNPYLFSGAPFLAHPGTAFFYPGTLLFLVLPLSLAFSWNYFIHSIIGGIGILYTLKRYTDDRLAGLVSCSLFVLSGYFAARIYAGHVDMYTTAVWIPWVFWSFSNYLDSGTIEKLWLPVVFITLEILAGYQAYVLFTFELLLAYTIYYSFFKKKLLIFSSLPIIFAILTSSVQWLATWQLSKLSIRGRGLPYELASWGSLPVSSLKLFFQPLNRSELDKISFNLGGGPLPNPFDHYLGALPLIFIIVYVLLAVLVKIFRITRTKVKVEKDFWFFLFTTLLFLWLAFAYFVTPNLHQLFYRLIPFYRFIRIPLQHLIIPIFLVPLMVGLSLSKIKNNLLKILLLLLFIFELLIFDRKYIFLTNKPESNYNPRLLSYLKENLKGERLLPHFRVVSSVLSSLDLNAAMKYKLYTTSGYDPVILDNYYSFIDSVDKSPQSSILSYNVEIPPLTLKREALRLLNIGYILAEKEQSYNYQKVLEGTDWILYKNKDTLPRYFLTEEKTDDTSCRQDLISEVKEVSRGINHVELKVRASCPSILSSSEVYYPGWKAKIDGRKVDTLINNTAFRSVFLPVGSRIVNFYYEPDIYYLGSGISLLGILGLVLITYMKRKKWRERQPSS